jgi:hypothetical protein
MMPDEFYRIAFRKKLYASIEALQADLDEWNRSYNEERPHQGRWYFGKTPLQTFLEAMPIAKEKMIAAWSRSGNSAHSSRWRELSSRLIAELEGPLSSLVHLSAANNRDGALVTHDPTPRIIGVQAAGAPEVPCPRLPDAGLHALPRVKYEISIGQTRNLHEPNMRSPRETRYHPVSVNKAPFARLIDNVYTQPSSDATLPPP